MNNDTYTAHKKVAHGPAQFIKCSSKLINYLTIQRDAKNEKFLKLLFHPKNA